MTNTNRIKELRNKKGLTLDEMAKKTGIKRGTLNNYENGKTEPKIKTWQDLANFFDVSTAYLQGIGLSSEDELNICLQLISHAVIKKTKDATNIETELGMEARLYLDAINRASNLDILLNDKKLSIDSEIVQTFFKVNFSSVVNINSVTALTGFQGGVVNKDFLQLQLSSRIKYKALPIAFPILKNLTNHANELRSETAELLHSRATRDDTSLPAAVEKKIESSSKDNIYNLISELQNDIKTIESNL